MVKIAYISGEAENSTERSVGCRMHLLPQCQADMSGTCRVALSQAVLLSVISPPCHRTHGYAP